MGRGDPGLFMEFLGVLSVYTEKTKFCSPRKNGTSVPSSTFAVSGLHRFAPEAPWLIFYAEHS
ncbi:MAG TPA: hypothetical protein DEB39_03595 [Planctomycetaceae bacterium]|nr:hypothetical protein [Planctomycetaceae bacterium]